MRRCGGRGEVQSPPAGGDARAPRMQVVQSFCATLSSGMRLLPSGSSPRPGRATPACAGDSRPTCIRAYPSYPCQSVFYSGSSRRSPPARARAELLKDHKPSARQSDARLRGRFPTNLHPCLSVISVPIRVLFRLFEAKPACAGYTGSFIQRPYQCNRTSYLCTRFAAPCPQCVLWRDDGGCATWYRALPASFRPLAQPVVGIWYSTLVPHPCCHQHCWTRRGGGEI